MVNVEGILDRSQKGLRSAALDDAVITIVLINK